MPVTKNAGKGRSVRQNCAKETPSAKVVFPPRRFPSPYVAEAPIMIVSRDRILTTHVGSLPRNERLSELLVCREAGEPYEEADLDAEMDKAVRHVVAKQKEAGIDSGNDGE